MEAAGSVSPGWICLCSNIIRFGDLLAHEETPMNESCQIYLELSQTLRYQSSPRHALRSGIE